MFRGIFVFLIGILLCSSAAATTLEEAAKESVDAAAGAAVIQGQDGYLFLKEELRHISAGKFWGDASAAASRTKNKKFADPVPAIVEYSRLLQEKGISLYLMVVPPKALVYPEKLAAGLTKASVAPQVEMYRGFYDELEKQGVKTIDLLPTLLENRDANSLYCKTDTHFSGHGLELFAKAAADELKKTDWYAGQPKNELEKTRKSITITGDLQQMSGSEGVGESLELTFVTDKKTGKPVESDPASPVVLLGDSHTLVFSAGGDLHAKGAGLFDNLSAELGFAVDLLGVRGSGVTPARIKLYQRSKKNKAYLDGKKALIWCFTAREITGIGGWKKIPVAP
jgi:hypothetical protein